MPTEEEIEAEKKKADAKRLAEAIATGKLIPVTSEDGITVYAGD